VQQVSTELQQLVSSEGFSLTRLLSRFAMLWTMLDLYLRSTRSRGRSILISRASVTSFLSRDREAAVDGVTAL